MTKNDRGKESGIHDSNKGNYDLNGSNGDLPSNVKEISFAEITLAKNDIVKEVIEKTKPFEYYDISAVKKKIFFCIYLKFLLYNCIQIIFFIIFKYSISCI